MDDPYSKALSLRLLSSRLAGDPDAYVLALNELGGCALCGIRLIHELVNLLGVQIETGGHRDEWETWIDRRLSELLDALAIAENASDDDT